MLDICVIVAAIRSDSGASRAVVDLVSTGVITAVLSDALANQYEGPLLQDAGDEMVIEAAINRHADIVTFNRRHFRPLLGSALESCARRIY